MKARYEYKLVVEGAEQDGYTAALDDTTGPLRGYGESPLQAVCALCETIREWPHGGAERWLGTPDGVQLGREFGLKLKPSNDGPS